jgi:hypothetical protein
MTDDAEALVPADAEQELDINERYRRWHEDGERRFQAIRNDGYGVGRALQAWGEIRTDEEWREKWLKAEEDYESGRFLVEQLGAERFLDPPMMAVLWSLRQRLLHQFDARGPAECMLVDLAILGYYNTLRLQRWIGDSSTTTEYELWGRESPTAKLKHDYGVVEGLRVEDIVEGLVQRLYPLLDRSNRMFIRNLRALKDLRTPPAPAVSIAQAGQVNVGAQQQNTMTGHEATKATPPPPGQTLDS